MMQLTIATPKKVLLAFAFALVLVAALASTQVFGQDNPNPEGSFNLSTTPVVATLETNPNQPVTTRVRVKNNNSTAEKINVSIYRFTSNNQDGAPQLLDAEAADPFLKWVTFSESKFVAEPNVWKDIDVTITPDATAAFGYYYAVAFSREAEQPQQGQTTSLSASVAVPLLLNVKAPGEVRKSDIAEFVSDKNVFEFLPAKFEIKLNNSGNTHVAPRGNIFITRGGKTVATLDVNKSRGNILPNSTRVFTAEWVDGSPVYKFKETAEGVEIKDGEQVSTLDWGNFDPSKLRIGKYTAKAALVYDDGKGDIATEAEVTFWVIPWRIIGVGFVVVLLVGAGLWATVLRPLRKGIKKFPTKKKTDAPK